MAEKTLDEIHWEKVSRARTFAWDSIEFNLDGDYGFMSIQNSSEKLDRALISFAAGYEDGLSLYLNENGRCTGAALLGDQMGLDVSFIDCANAWFNQCHRLDNGEIQADAEAVKEAKEQYLKNARECLDEAQRRGQPEYEFGEAEYLLVSGKRAEAKAAFMKIYRENKNLSYEAASRIQSMYREEHPEIGLERPRTIFEKWGENTALQLIVYVFALALFVLRLSRPLAIAMVALNLYATKKFKDYLKRLQENRRCPDVDLDKDFPKSVYTVVKNPVSPEVFKVDFLSDRPVKPDHMDCTKKVEHKERYRDADGHYYTRTYTTEEPDYDKMNVQDRQYKYNMVQWHNGVMEKVRLCRIENWKRLKTRVEQGDERAARWMNVMGFDMEHHNNGVAKLPTRLNSVYEGFTYNTIAAWAPYEDIDS